MYLEVIHLHFECCSNLYHGLENNRIRVIRANVLFLTWLIDLHLNKIFFVSNIDS